MYIEEIIVDGFKSYATRTVIAGFDRRFNAITGLNGSGKSNILDSICFVLGISNLSQVRAGNLNELVYKQGQAGVTKASVTIVFNNSEREHSPVGYEEFEQITVTRQVVIGGRNKYLINGHTAQLSRVQNLFHSVQLNVNNPHFLIMQGRITKVINMKPPEVLGMIEEAAGTRMFEMKRESAVKTIEKKDAKVDEIKKVLEDEISPTLDKLRSERSQFMAFTASSAECERLERLCTAHEYHAARQAREGAAAAADAAKTEHARQLLTIENAARDKAAREADAEAALAERERQTSAAFRALEGEAEELEREVVKATAAYTHKRDAAQRERDAAAAHRAAAKELSAQGAEADAGALSERVDALTAEHDAAAEQLRQREATYEAQLGVGADATANTLTAQIQAAADAQTAAVSAAKQAALRAKHVAKELGDADKKLRGAKKEGEALQAELDGLVSAEAAARERLSALAASESAVASLTAEHRERETAAAGARAKADALGARLSAARFEYAKPSSSFDASRVKGPIVELVRVTEQRMAVALEVAAGGRLHHVVVDTDGTAKQLLERGKLARRTTFVPLNRIAAKAVPAAKLEAARKLVGAGSVWSPLELLEYDADLEAAVQYAFGGALVCADADAARACAFDKRVGVACVTLQGDLFNPQGTLTGGSRAPAGEGLLARMGQLRTLRADADAAEAGARELGARLERAAAEADEAARLQGELQLSEQAQQLARERLAASAYGQLLAARDALAADAKACDAAQASAHAAEACARARIAELRQQQDAFSKDHGAQLKLLKKQIGEEKKAVARLAKGLGAARDEAERARLAQASTDDERTALLAQADAAERDAAAIAAEASAMEAALAAKRARAAELDEQLGAQREQLAAHAQRASSLRAEAAALAKRVDEAKLDAKRSEQKLARAKREAESAGAAVSALLRQHAWIGEEEKYFGVAGTDYDFGARDVGAAATRLASLRAEHDALSKRINKKALAMFERAEAEHDELCRKKAIIEADKGKIEKVIAELDAKKKEALEKTWAKVNTDFGAIFSTLLPHSNAKLQPPDGQTIHDGLCIHVALGDVWKSSLLELSGGQRSLVALSLVLALLLFKPAPLYILDEVDAALDLSHTQNIGTMIRRHFTQSQFVIVSLKEGMFNNANVIFRTQFVDGVSTVSRTVINSSEPEGGDKAKGRPAAAKPHKRGALAAAN